MPVYLATFEALVQGSFCLVHTCVYLLGMNTNEAARMLSDSQTSHTRWAACTQRCMRLLNMFTGLGEVPWLVPPWTIRGCPADAASLRLEHQLDPMGRPPWPPMPRIARQKGGGG